VASTTYADIGLSANITPATATNKVLVTVTVQAETTRSSSQNGWGVKILRDSTAIWTASSVSGEGPTDTSYLGAVISSMTLSSIQTIQILDSPATTSQITYKVQGACKLSTSSGTVKFQTDRTGTDGTSIIVLQEVVA
jgi:hypothetical protein